MINRKMRLIYIFLEGRGATRQVRIMGQIVVIKKFNTDAFICGHPYCIKREGNIIYALFVRATSDSVLVFETLQKADINRKSYGIYAVETEVSIDEVVDGKTTIHPMLISEKEDDELPDTGIGNINGDDSKETDFEYEKSNEEVIVLGGDNYEEDDEDEFDDGDTFEEI